MKKLLIFLLAIIININTKAQTGNLCSGNEPTDYIPYKEEANFFPIRNIRIAFHVINGDNNNETIPAQGEYGLQFINSIINKMNELMSNYPLDNCTPPCNQNMSFELTQAKQAITDTRIRYVKNYEHSITFHANETYYQTILQQNEYEDADDYVRTTVHNGIMTNYSTEYRDNVIHLYLIDYTTPTSGTGGVKSVLFNMKQCYNDWLNNNINLDFIATVINHELAHVIGRFSDVSGDDSRHHLSNVFFTDATVGYTTSLGKILKTSSSGDSWSMQEFTTEKINTILFTNNGINGYALENGGLWTSTNSGTSWDKLDHPVPYLSNLQDIYFSDIDNGYMIANYMARLFKTTNAGENWTQLLYRSNTHFYSIAGISSNSFCVVGKYGSDGAIFIFKNDELSQEILLPGKKINSVVFINSTTGYAVGEEGEDDGFLLKLTYTDKWYTSSITLNYPTKLNSISFGNSLVGYIVGNYNGTNDINRADVFRTSDGGLNWSRVPEAELNIGEHLHDVYLTDANNIFIAGDYINLIKSNDGGINWSNDYLKIASSLPGLVNFYNWNYANDHCTYRNGGSIAYNNNILTYNPSNQKSYSAKQIGAMHASTYGYAWRRNPANDFIDFVPSEVGKFVRKDWCYYDPNENMTIPTGTNVTFKSPRFLAGDLIIQDGATLTIKCMVSMPLNGIIKVEKGGKLIVDGGYITNECGLMWKGILVLGDKTISQGNLSQSEQGYVILKNEAIIEHAQIGVSVGTIAANEMQNGGILRAEGCTFRNCGQGVIFYPYSSPTRPTSNYSYFQGCTFIASETLPIVLTNLINNYTSVFVKLDNVQGIRFYNNTFINTTGRSDNGTIGIQSENSSLLVQKQFLNGEEPCTPPSGVETNIFEGLEIGIDIKNTMDKRKAKIYDNEFKNVTIGIRTDNDENTTIYYNNFEYTNNFNRINRQPNPIAINFNSSRNLEISVNNLST
jgi:photosystem II stability/assembly factor-like uncharacterized protein